ncbi:MAG: 16S rRNA (cytosine(967)-C(5))-methyltransferase, partial [Pseudomonadales bacterium]
ITADAGDTDTWWDEQPFDRILLDATCSGTGIISHHPDIKFLRRSGDLAQFAEQQSTLLNKLWPLLKDGGQLLYCTCSIMSEENAAVIDKFLMDTPSAKALPIDAQWGVISGSGRQLLPNKGKNGGFFYARLSKSATL